MSLEYEDPIPSWDSELSFSTFTPSPAGDVAAPNDSLSTNLAQGLASIGNKSIDFFSKTADFLVGTLGNIAQAKSSWDTITNPSSAKPVTTQDHSQLPSLQPANSTLGQLINWQGLKNALAKVGVGTGSNTIDTSSSAGSYIPTLLILGTIATAAFLIMRPKHGA